MLLEVQNLIKRYHEILAVDHVNLNIAEGEIFGLLGPNGAGKTTILNSIIGLTRIDGGEICVFGKNIQRHEQEIKGKIGIVPQDIAIFEDLTAYENVVFFGRLYGLKDRLLRERAEEALAFTGLAERKRGYPKKFSGGMKRRLNIACALVHHPELIIMDEPTVGIDPQSRKHILESVKKLNELGSTILYTSHYMEEVEELCTRLAIMDQGRIIAQGTRDELKALIASDEKVDMELSAVNYSIVEMVKNIPGVRECMVRERRLEVISTKNSRNLGKIIDGVSAGGGEILTLNVYKPTLEDVFLTLTGKSLRDH